jgi:hypothetical protein
MHEHAVPAATHGGAAGIFDPSTIFDNRFYLKWPKPANFSRLITFKIIWYKIGNLKRHTLSTLGKNMALPQVTVVDLPAFPS